MTDRLEETFNHVVDRAPDATAIDAPDGKLTLARLAAWAEAIQAGLGPSCVDQPVGVFMPPGRAYFAALVGCMKAGVMAVPIDPEFPDEQIQSVLRHLRITRCLSTRTLAGRLRKEDGIQVVVLSQNPPSSFPKGMDGPAQRNGGIRRLHCISTSGSSGHRTHAIIGRDAIVVHAQEMGVAYEYRPGTCVAHLARYTSAAGINGFWRALLGGVGLVCFDLRAETFAQVHRRVAGSGAVVLQGTPTVLEAFARACKGLDRLSKVRQVIVGGEPISAAALGGIATVVHPECMAYVNYSSTETLHVAVHRAPLRELAGAARIPVGRPLPSRSVALFDPDGRAVPDGALGEIVVTSAHIALELIGDGVDGRLRVDADDPSRRVYWTRDLGRWNEDGLLEHHGRGDRQLKIRGERVMPTAVERELESIQGIKRAAVVGVPDAFGPLRLCACLLRDPVPATVDMIRRQLERRLAGAAIPTLFVDIESLPLGPTGKTDYRALESVCSAALAGDNPADVGSASSAPGLIDVLRSEWSAVLGRPVESDGRTFVEHGGDSLAAAALATALARRFGLRLAPLWVARHPTLATQAEEISKMLTGNSEGSRLETERPVNPSRRDEPPDRIDMAAVRRRIGWV
ncbi:MAG: AMP-binding protein [Candidatus Contendobacter sp.]|nr:AMP-binding protein [Candidatus Contendobacter sp.]MDG4556206.1 AMP-binding protein [Candidatus Contendobacter sp.]